SHKVLAAVSNLGFAYRITGEKKYAKAAIRWMVNSARWPRWTYDGWSMSDEKRVAITGEGESFATSVLLQTMAIGVELCFSEMVDHDLFEILGGVVTHARRIVDDYKAGRPWFFAFKAVHSNQFTIPVASLGIAAFVFKKWAPEGEEWLALAKKLTLQGLDAQSADGAYAEGLAYANYGAKDYVLFAEVLASGGDLSLIQHPHLKNLPQWVTDMTGPDGKRHVNINDCRQTYWLEDLQPLEYSKHAMVMYGKQFVWYQRRYPNRGFRDYLMKVFGGLPESHWTLAWYNPEEKDKSVSKPFSGFRSYPMFGFHPWRGKIGKEDVLMGLVAGKEQKGHKHPDTGALLLYAGNDYLLTDAGTCVYSDPDGKNYFQKTFAHNTILVDGEGQILGSGGNLISQGGNGDWKWIVIDGDRAYEGLSLFRRVLLFSTKDKVFYVMDHGVFKKPGKHQIDWLWHSEGKMKLDPDASGREGFGIEGKEQKLKMRVLPLGKNESQGKSRMELRDGFLDAPGKPSTHYVAIQKEFSDDQFWSVSGFSWGVGLELEKQIKSTILLQKKGLEMRVSQKRLLWDGHHAPKVVH
ncbi:MAG: heparinase II/III family protein, partial [Verrucomicrobiota bacterium]